MNYSEYHENTGMQDYRDDLNNEVDPIVQDAYEDALIDGEEWALDAYLARWDDDPNPYHGDYSEM